MISDGCFSAGPTSKALQAHQTDEDQLRVQKKGETVTADPTGETKTSESTQQADGNQKNVDQPLTSVQSESPKQPADAKEEPETLTVKGTSPETENIAEVV